MGEDCVLKAAPIERAPELLQALLDLYWKGLTRPLKFFPKTSLAYAEAVLKLKPGESVNRALEKARPEWEGNAYTRSRGEKKDAYLDRCFGSTDPLDEEFQQIAEAVYQPLLDALKEEEA